MGEVFDTAYIPDRAQRLDRLASPAWGANADEIVGIAPAVVVTAEHDRLRDEATDTPKAACRWVIDRIPRGNRSRSRLQHHERGSRRHPSGLSRIAGQVARNGFTVTIRAVPSAQPGVDDGADHRLQQFHEVIGVAFVECASAYHASHEQHFADDRQHHVAARPGPESCRASRRPTCRSNASRTGFTDGGGSISVHQRAASPRPATTTTTTTPIMTNIIHQSVWAISKPNQGLRRSALRCNMAVHSLSGSEKRLRAADLAAIRRARLVV